MSRLDQAATDLVRPCRPRAQRRDQRHRETREAARKEGDQAERVLVGPVEVVEGEEQRTVTAPLDPVQQAQVGSRRLDRRFRDSVAVPQHLGAERIESLPEEAERQHPLHLVAATVPDLEVSGRDLDRSFQHRGLAETCLGDDEECAAPPRPGAVEDALLRREHLLAFQQAIHLPAIPSSFRHNR